MSPTAFGICLLVVAGLMNGSFTAPMKFTRRWEWENTWMAWTLFALFAFPIALTLKTVPGALGIYWQSGAFAVALGVAVFGFLWGVSQIFLGLAVDAIGMALSMSVIMGLSSAVGALIPLMQTHAEQIRSSGGRLAILGIVIVLAGVAVCGAAGKMRERATKRDQARRVGLVQGLFFCTISGVGSAFVNLGLNYGKPLTQYAELNGATPQWMNNAVWLPLMIAGGIPNLLYTIYLMRKKGTHQRFATPGTHFHWLLAAVMAFFWFGSTVMYGIAALKMGDMGTILGWPIFMSLIVIVATLWGVFTGEWKTAGLKPLATLSGGVGLLVVAIAVLSKANAMMTAAAAR